MKVVLQNLTKTFPSRNKKSNEEVVAVSDFSFTIPDGQLIGLLGPSGCGKSTTLYMISGLQKPTSGRIFFGDDDVTGLSTENRGIGLVFQNYALYPHMTVKQNILFPLQNLRGADKLSKDEMLDRAQKAARLVQIEELMERKPSELSGGQQQRVAIARALVNEPEVLLLDEPLGALDLKLRKEMQLELKSMQKRLGITFIYVTHDQEEALTMSDTVVVMRDGHILQIGDPKRIYDEPVNAFVADFIGESNILRGTMVRDELVRFAGNEFPCVDAGFGENVPVDVVVRPEDIMLVGEDIGQISGVVQSVLFKGVHYEMMIDAGHTVFKVHSTVMQPQGSRVGLTIVPYNIHIMKPMDDAALRGDEEGC